MIRVGGRVKVGGKSQMVGLRDISSSNLLASRWRDVGFHFSFIISFIFLCGHFLRDDISSIFLLSIFLFSCVGCGLFLVQTFSKYFSNTFHF